MSFDSENTFTMESKAPTRGTTAIKVTIEPENPLHTGYDQALGTPEGLLVNTMLRQSIRLEVMIPARPCFCYMQRSEPTSTGEASCRRSSSMSDEEVLHGDPLKWRLARLPRVSEVQRRSDCSMLFQVPDEHLATCPAKDPVVWMRSRLPGCPIMPRRRSCWHMAVRLHQH